MAALLQLVAARGGAFPRPGNKWSRDQCVNRILIMGTILEEPLIN